MGGYTKHAMDFKAKKRYEFIKENIGFGEVIDEFYWDRGHPNGAEIHILTTTGIVIVKNARTENIITYLIARPSQIRRYYDMNSLDTPKYLIYIAKKHQMLGWNEI